MALAHITCPTNRRDVPHLRQVLQHILQQSCAHTQLVRDSGIRVGSTLRHKLQQSLQHLATSHHQSCDLVDQYAQSKSNDE
jgi:hypothetical protein